MPPCFILMLKDVRTVEMLRCHSKIVFEDDWCELKSLIHLRTSKIGVLQEAAAKCIRHTVATRTVAAGAAALSTTTVERIHSHCISSHTRTTRANIGSILHSNTPRIVITILFMLM